MKTELKNHLLKLPGFQGLCRLLTRNHVRALMYHRFSTIEENSPPFPDPLMLHSQMKHLVQNHTLWHPDKHLAQLKGNKPKGSCPVVITVDDGYWDFYQVAFPVFREFKIPAMLFLTTGFVDGKNWFWWDRLAYIFNEAKPISLNFVISGRDYALDLISEDKKNLAWNEIADRCRFLSNSDKEKVISDLANCMAVDVPTSPPPQYSAVTWAQVQEMQTCGIYFGAHTVTHPILSRVSLARAKEEIVESRRALTEKLGVETTWFCYPQGGPADFTPEVRTLVAEAKFKGCYVAYQDLANSHDPFIMPRYCCTRDMIEFKWTLCGAEYIFLKLKQRLGRPTGPGEVYWAGSN